MKIYNPGQRGKMTTFVTPGNEFPVAHFLDPNGNPTMFSVVFIDGVADIEDTLAQYMLDKDMAKPSPIILLS